VSGRIPPSGLKLTGPPGEKKKKKREEVKVGYTKNNNRGKAYSWAKRVARTCPN